MKGCLFDENKKVFFIHEKDYNKTFQIEQNMTYRFIILYNENYYYSFRTSDILHQMNFNEGRPILFLDLFVLTKSWFWSILMLMFVCILL